MTSDIRHALRLLARNPSFAAVAILTLTLGIGANTAVFSVLDATLLKPLPFADPDRLVDILEIRGKGTAEERRFIGMTRERLAAWKAQTQIFEAIEADGNPDAMTVEGAERPINVAPISPGVFPLLGVSPVLGRGFLPGDAVPGANDVLLISDAYWSRAFGRTPDVIGRTLVLDRRRMTIVGVMPPTAKYPIGYAVDAWRPLPNAVDARDPASHHKVIGVVARLRSGLTPESAQPAVDAAALAIQRGTADRAWGASLDPIDPRRWRSEGRPLVLIAFGAVALVLLAACANLANLLLARTFSRQRELAIRRALGASRLRVARQLLVESLVLAVAGGATAILAARWLIGALPAILPPRTIAFPVHEALLDWRVLAFAGAASVAVGILCGVLPSLRGSTEQGVRSISAAATTTALARPPRRARNAFIAAQVAFATILLTGAGLLTASVTRMVTSDPGYELNHLIGVDVALPRESKATRAEQQVFFEQLLENIRTLPGVAAATFGTPPPEDGAGGFVAEGSEGDPTSAGPLALIHTGPQYLQTLRISLAAGRDFTPDDRIGSTPVAIVDEDAARRYWPGQDPLGKRVRYSPYVPWITVVGIARNIKTSDVGRAVDAFELYLPLTQAQRIGATTMLIRASGDAQTLAAAVRSHVSALDRTAAVTWTGTIEELYGPALARPKFAALLLSTFAALALVTLAVGLYGVLSYSVAQRIPEIGVRRALGAGSREVRRLIVGDVLRPVMAGLLLGVLAAAWLSRFIGSQLYHVSRYDPVTMALVLATLLLAGLVAVYVPTRRAIRIDPMVALRSE
jgi:putative ABC transport system permease protein